MAGSFRVNQDNVLQAHAAALHAADRVRGVLESNGRDMRLEAMGTDPVSIEAAAAFTSRLQKYVMFGWNYVNELERLAGSLREAALTYGYTDDEVARGFPSSASRA